MRHTVVGKILPSCTALQICLSWLCHGCFKLWIPLSKRPQLIGGSLGFETPSRLDLAIEADGKSNDGMLHRKGRIRTLEFLAFVLLNMEGVWCTDL
ncbi:hypothetical protein V8E51_006805 [Hyaloscypha variabilis]